MWGKTFTVVAMGAGLALPATAGAAGPGTLDLIPLPGAANSVARAPDGAVWVSLPTRGTVARVASDGTVTESATLGGGPIGIAVVEGKVFAALTDAKKIAIIDAGNPATVTTVATPAGSCGPVAVADGGNGTVYVSLPNDGGGTASCPNAAPSAITRITTSGVLGPTVQNRGTAFDLLVTGGALWIPDFNDDRLRRTALDAGLSPQAVFTTPPSAGPDGLTVAPGGDVVVSLFGADRLGRVSPTAQSSTSIVLFGPPVSSPFGVGYVGDSLYAAGSAAGGGAASIARVLPDLSLGGSTVPPGPSQPWDVAPGPDGSVVVTDLVNPRLLRITSRPPRVATGAPLEANTIFARVALTVNPGGNPATTSVQFGTTTVYGSSAVAGVPSGTADAAATATLEGLQQGTTYHYRAVATSAEGTAVGEDRTFTTAVKGPPPNIMPPASTPAPLPKLAARTTFTTSIKKGVTRVTKIRVTGLVGGETITVSCSGKGCPKKGKTVTVQVKKAGSATVKAPKITKARFGKGAKVTVQVTKPGFVGAVATATAQKAKKPTVKAECLASGTDKASTC